MSSRVSATIVFRTMFGPAIDWLEPTARNSNLLPVKANGLVRLRSPASRGSFGRTETPIFIVAALLADLGAALFDLLEDVLELVAQEDRDDGRRGLVGAQPVVVAGDGDGHPQQVAVLVRRPDDGRAGRQELGVLVRRVAGLSRFSPWSSAIDQLLCLPEPLMPANGFSCSRQAGRSGRPRASSISMTSMLWSVARLAFSKIGAISYWRGRDFVVPGLDRHAQLEQLGLGLEHAGQDAFGDGAEVVVFQLLALRRLGAEEGAAGVDQVGPGEVEVLVDQEVFLLGADGGEDAAGRLMPKSLRTRRACLERASIERSSGVFLSRASPVQEQKAVGMHSVVPLGFSRMNAGLVGSQAV